MRSKHLGLNHVGPWILLNIQWQAIGGLEAHSERDLNNILKDCPDYTVQGIMRGARVKQINYLEATVAVQARDNATLVSNGNNGALERGQILALYSSKIYRN